MHVIKKKKKKAEYLDLLLCGACYRVLLHSIFLHGVSMTSLTNETNESAFNSHINQIGELICLTNSKGQVLVPDTDVLSNTDIRTQFAQSKQADSSFRLIKH